MNHSMSPKSNPSSHHNPPQHSVPCQYETDRPSPCSVFFPTAPWISHRSLMRLPWGLPLCFLHFQSCHYHLSYLDNATEVLLHSLLIRGSLAPSHLPSSSLSSRERTCSSPTQKSSKLALYPANVSTSQAWQLRPSNQLQATVKALSSPSLPKALIAPEKINNQISPWSSNMPCTVRFSCFSNCSLYSLHLEGNQT